MKMYLTKRKVKTIQLGRVYTVIPFSFPFDINLLQKPR